MINKLHAEEIKNDYLYRGMVKDEIISKWFKKLQLRFSDVVIVVDAIVDDARRRKTTFNYFNKRQPVMGHKKEAYFEDEMQYGTFPNYGINDLMSEYSYE